MNRKILSYDDVEGIQFGTINEPLVEANTYDSRIICEDKKFDMFAWTGFDILVRDSVARKLAEVNATLQEQYKLNLKVVYGYRSLSVQRRYFEKRFNELRPENPNMNNDELRRLTHNFVAIPDTAGHTLGAAIDITLVDENKEECDMGTDVADYGDPLAIQTFASVNTRQSRRRKVLLNVMVGGGFAPFLGEWWHFSYGDKEWAAYYGHKQALYAPIDISMKAKVYTIAGGNKTALQIADTWRGDERNRMAGEALMAAFPDVDQAGIYYIDTNKLEMAGGEFCGNATAATAALLSDKQRLTYHVSGLQGQVDATVAPVSATQVRVTARFCDMRYNLTYKKVFGVLRPVVEFDGITHILIEENFPRNYMLRASLIRQEVQLAEEDAVGVIWFKRVNDSRVQINPVVWVKQIDTLFYESSCGSGAMAAAIALGANEIIQPTGQAILVEALQRSIRTISDVEMVC